MIVTKVKTHRIELPHGTKSGYSHWGCRCEKCREGNLAYQNTFYEKCKFKTTGDAVKPYKRRDKVPQLGEEK